MRCGIYLRISREDGLGESNSIANQRKILHAYLEEHSEMSFTKEWVDDGKTGSNYDREGFQAMLQAAARGEIACLLCKDLSRLGREYIQTGYYLQKIFPMLGLRVIAVADDYDSAKTDFLEQALLFPVINLMNDAYCRDISGKVRWQQKIRRQQGDYIGAFACYGYRKSETEIHRLVVDEDVQEIVKCIYRLCLSGMAAENIASVLNMGQIPSPRAYKTLQGSRFRSGFDGKGGEHWSPLSVRRILANRMYTGVMIQGKDTKISYKMNLRQKIPREDWIQVPGKVPVLIPSWVADRICDLKQQRLRCHRGKVYCELFAGYRLSQKGEILCKKCWDICNSIFGKNMPPERWKQRLLLVLLVRTISIDFSKRVILADVTFQKEM
jgi:DNA invertase Pin-like site-specific DNA recombinase